jgi:hypothetical protein
MLSLTYHGEHDLGLALHVRVKDTKNVLELAFLRDKERLLSSKEKKKRERWGSSVKRADL